MRFMGFTSICSNSFHISFSLVHCAIFIFMTHDEKFSIQNLYLIPEKNKQKKRERKTSVSCKQISFIKKAKKSEKFFISSKSYFFFFSLFSLGTFSALIKHSPLGQRKFIYPSNQLAQKSKKGRRKKNCILNFSLNDIYQDIKFICCVLHIEDTFFLYYAITFFLLLTLRKVFLLFAFSHFSPSSSLSVAYDFFYIKMKRKLHFFLFSLKMIYFFIFFKSRKCFIQKEIYFLFKKEM